MRRRECSRPVQATAKPRDLARLNLAASASTALSGKETRTRRASLTVVFLAGALSLLSCGSLESAEPSTRDRFVLDAHTPSDAALLARLAAIDEAARLRHGLTTEQAAVGLLDLRDGRVAMIHPDRIEYAASVAKIGILLAWFEVHREAATDLASETRHELGLMIKASSNEMATKFSREIGLKRIQQVLDSYDLYDANRGGGLWVGRHYGSDEERIGDPVADHSHAATVRQLLRFYSMLEQGQLVSPAASAAMRGIFASPDIPHDDIKFVKGLAGRDVEILRKWGSWQDWLHDTAAVTGTDRRYVLVALTHHPQGDAYLVDLAAAVDDAMSRPR